MPTVNAYRRSPLLDRAYTPLPDAAVHPEGALARWIRAALQHARADEMTPLDSMIATKLGEYTQLPAMPDLDAALLQAARDPRFFLSTLRAATMRAAAERDKEGMLWVLAVMRDFQDRMPGIEEGALFEGGADGLRVAQELYRRTGQKFLLTVMERFRALLPDVSGFFHMFPFLKAFTPEKTDPKAEDETSRYHRRMERLATGRLTADALSMTALLGLYSGSARDASAAKAGLMALQRYHGLSSGAFSADPYLAGRDPSRASELQAVCAQAEALYDVLAAEGNLQVADQLELLFTNALCDLLTPEGARALQPVNRLTDDESCLSAALEARDVAALLRAGLAMRRALWMAREEDEIALLMPMDGRCLTRLNGAPVRLTAVTSGTCFERIVNVAVEAKTPVDFTLSLRIPGYAEGATVSVNGGRSQEAKPGALHSVARTFKTGDTVTLRLPAKPRMETGYRGSVSVYVASTLMALPLPESGDAWQYALAGNAPLKPSTADGRPAVLAVACEAPGWTEKDGFIAPPPQGTRLSAAYELTLLPYAGTGGRIASFPLAGRRE